MKKVFILAATAAFAGVMMTGCGSSKEGWMVTPGMLPVKEQVTESNRMLRTRDSEGQLKYYAGNGLSVGEFYDAAKITAIQVASINLAAAVEKTVMGAFESAFSTDEKGKKEAVSALEVNGGLRTVIATRLRNTITATDMYRELKNGNVEVSVLLLYDKKKALEEAEIPVKEVIRKEMKEKARGILERMDKELGWGQ
jgi:hypothetical protein